MIEVIKYFFIVLVCSLLFVPSAVAQKQEVTAECFKSMHRDNPGTTDACRVEKDFFLPQTQNVILECESYVDFDNRAGYTAYAGLALKVGKTTKQRTSKRGPDSEPAKDRTRLSVYWDGEIRRGVHRLICEQENYRGDCLQTQMCIYY